MTKRRNKDTEPELTEKGLIEVNDELANTTVSTVGFVQTLPEEDEPDMEVTVTTSSVNDDGSVEFTKRTYIEPGRKAEKKESNFINEIVTAIAEAKGGEPKELRKADPAIVAMSKANQAKKHAADNPFGKKVTPEIYKVKHNPNDERMTDTDLIDNVMML